MPANRPGWMPGIPVHRQSAAVSFGTRCFEDVGGFRLQSPSALVAVSAAVITLVRVGELATV